MVAPLKPLPEELPPDAVDVLVRLVGAAGAAVPDLGALPATAQFFGVLPTRRPDRFAAVRLTLARFLVAGLEFQVASAVLGTAIARSFEKFGKLAAVAADPPPVAASNVG